MCVGVYVGEGKGCGVCMWRTAMATLCWKVLEMILMRELPSTYTAAPKYGAELRSKVQFVM